MTRFCPEKKNSDTERRLLYRHHAVYMECCPPERMRNGGREKTARERDRETESKRERERETEREKERERERKREKEREIYSQPDKPE